MIHVTGHAISRYQERVENLPEAKVRRSCPAPRFWSPSKMVPEPSSSALATAQ